MKLSQLRSFCDIVDRDFNISRAARALHTSQPGISKQIRTLEEELGRPLFLRKSREVTGLTESGKQVLLAARRILLETQGIRDKVREAKIRLSIATTPTQGRYVVLPALKRFSERYPNAELVLHQGSPTEIAQWVREGEVDIGIASEPVTRVTNVVYSPCNRLEVGVITPCGHPLLRSKRIALKDLARYPLIARDPSFPGGRMIMQRFRSEGLEPNMAISVNGVSSDLIKSYVAAGFGIALLPVVAYDRRRDSTLRIIPAKHLFNSSVNYIIRLEGRHVEAHEKDFIAYVRSASSALQQSASLVKNKRPPRTRLSLT